MAVRGGGPVRRGRRGPIRIQAHLAAAHSTAPSWQETDWDRIVGLYDLLGSITANPVVALNRAVAVTERDGPEAGLAALKTIVGLEYSHLWHAALADNLRRLGYTSEAAGELHTAVTLAPSEVEQRLLQGRLCVPCGPCSADGLTIFLACLSLILR